MTGVFPAIGTAISMYCLLGYGSTVWLYIGLATTLLPFVLMFYSIVGWWIADHRRSAGTPL